MCTWFAPFAAAALCPAHRHPAVLLVDTLMIVPVLLVQMDALAVYVNGKTDGTQLADIRQAATTLAIAKHKCAAPTTQWPRCDSTLLTLTPRRDVGGATLFRCAGSLGSGGIRTWTRRTSA